MAQVVDPPPGPHHPNYSKREMAKDMVELMSRFGHERFGIVAHDHGARVGYRLALDSPRRVSHLVSLDTVPTLEIWDAWDMAASIEGFHWTLPAQPVPVPERMMGADPDSFVTHLPDRRAARPNALDPAAVAHFKDAFQFRKSGKPWRKTIAPVQLSTSSTTGGIVRRAQGSNAPSLRRADACTRQSRPARSGRDGR